MTILTPDFDIAGAVLSDAQGGATEQCGNTTSEEASEDSLAEDARLYLRHVEGGKSIRAIAREVGCHASTILRRIRRFESRRDDPLVDEALQAIGLHDMPKRNNRHNQDQTRRILRRLAEPGAELVVASGMAKAIVTRDEIRTAILDRKLAEQLALNEWVEPITQGQRMLRYRISAGGRATLRNLLHGSGGLPKADDFANARPVTPDGLAESAAAFDYGSQHRVWANRKLPDPDTGKPRRMRINLAESPLLLLARRRDAKGNPFLSSELVTAGERLREDFELAQMGPRVTQNWDRFMTSGIDVSIRADQYGGGSTQARNRVADALRELGPGMGDLVLRVCCFLEGLEMTERRLGWSARSGKVVLKLALERLARHYEERYGPGGPLIG
ncbi:MAG: DUF6456 domain-containing protein [Paracoccus sp. (in: a-proteobacteria)]